MDEVCELNVVRGGRGGARGIGEVVGGGIGV